MIGHDPPATNSSVILPPEILDKILEHIPTHTGGRPTLIACALVATWWTGPSQRRLFSSVSISEHNHWRWMNGVVRTESKARLLALVRSLSHRCGRDIGTKYPTRDLELDSGGYFSALPNVHSLTLRNLRVEHTSERQFRICFSAFRETLTYLSLEVIATSLGAFVTLVDYFPNITTLQLRSFVLEPDDGPVPPPSRPFQGKLYIGCFQDDRLEFFDRFAKLNLEYEELVIAPTALFTYEKRKLLEIALQISTSTVKFLRLMTEIESGITPTIDGFRQLQELELVVTWPKASHEALLSSITSTRLRKIIFRVRYTANLRYFPAGMDGWTSMDEQLCRLVDRLCAAGCSHTLEAELRFGEIIGDPGRLGFAAVLPRFKEKGVVTIMGTDRGGRLFYSSAHIH